MNWMIWLEAWYALIMLLLLIFYRTGCGKSRPRASVDFAATVIIVGWPVVMLVIVGAALIKRAAKRSSRRAH